MLVSTPRKLKKSKLPQTAPDDWLFDARKQAACAILDSTQLTQSVDWNWPERGTCALAGL